MLQLLIQKVDVIRRTESQSETLGITSTDETVYSQVPASVQPTTSAVQILYGQRQVSVTNTVFVAKKLTLQKGDKLTCKGLDYYVEGWRDLSGRGRVWAIDVREWK